MRIRRKLVTSSADVDLRRRRSGRVVVTLTTMRTLAAAKRMWAGKGPRARDILVVALSLVTTIAIAIAPDRRLGAWWPAGLAAGLVATAALWWRRRFPAAVTLLVMPVFVLTGNPLPLAVGLFSLAIRRRDRVLVALTVLSAAVFAIGQHFDTSTSIFTMALLASVEAGFVAAAGAYIGARRDLLSSLRERAAKAEEERELRAEQARISERARIAREMHDVLAHRVSLIALHAGALEVNADTTQEQVHVAASIIRTTAREAMEDLRDVLGVLRSEQEAGDSDLVPQPRTTDIQRMVDQSRAAGLQAELTIDVPDLPDAVARTAYRVVQEALTNVHKHARSAATTVAVLAAHRRDEGDGVTVDVTNQRPVAATALLPGSGSGLVGLRERVELMGGSLDFGPCPDGGWRVSAWLPIRPVNALISGVSA